MGFSGSGRSLVVFKDKVVLVLADTISIEPIAFCGHRLILNPFVDPQSRFVIICISCYTAGAIGSP